MKSGLASIDREGKKRESAIYFNARYYDPIMGRFLTEDPARKGSGWYTYCGNNPVNAIDPTGRYVIIAESATTKQREQINTALSYINLSPTGQTVIERVDVSPLIITIKPNNRGDDSYNPVSNTINWDPVSGLETKRGKIQTPALGLAHELGHAKQDIENQLAGKTRAQIESENLAIVENPIANELDEPIRTEYSDVKDTPETKGPVSNEPAKKDKIICAELFRQGLMDMSIYDSDEKFGQMMARSFPLVMGGYTILAKPVVKKMKQSRSFSMLVNKFTKPWSYEMAYLIGDRKKGDSLGLIIMVLGFFLCGIIGILANVFMVLFSISYATYPLRRHNKKLLPFNNLKEMKK